MDILIIEGERQLGIMTVKLKVEKLVKLGVIDKEEGGSEIEKILGLVKSGRILDLSSHAFSPDLKCIN